MKTIIDPGSKWFITLFSVVVLGTIGFLIASIFLNFDGDDELKTIKFGRSNFSIKINQQKSDKRYVLEVYNGSDNCAILLSPIIS